MFSDPQGNVFELHLRDGQIVADLGTGSGHYAMHSAKAVAPTGKVFAVDIQKELLSRLQKEAHKNHFRNIEIITGDLEHLGGTKIRESLCDVVIISNTLFMITNKKNLILEAKRILKPRGRLLVIDWAGSFSGMGPHSQHVLYKEECMKLVLEAGFEVDHEINAGSHHYGIIFRKP